MQAALVNRPANWPPETTEALLSLLSQDLSATQIGEKLEVSRSAVLGRVKRLRDNGENFIHVRAGAAAPGGSRRLTDDKRKKRLSDRNNKLLAKRMVAKKAAADVRGLPLFDAASLRSGVPIKVALPEPVSMRVPLIDRTCLQCNWMSGDDGTCCGHEVSYRSFCAHHALRAYVPYRPKGSH